MVVVAIGATLYAAVPATMRTLFGEPLRAELIGFIALTLPVTLNIALSEASRWHATWGKRRVGSRVSRIDGSDVPLPRSLVRSAVKFLPWGMAPAAISRFTVGKLVGPGPADGLLVGCWLLVPLNIGTALVHRQHRAIHDPIAGTIVLKGD